MGEGGRVGGKSVLASGGEVCEALRIGAAYPWMDIIFYKLALRARYHWMELTIRGHLLFIRYCHDMLYIDTEPGN